MSDKDPTYCRYCTRRINSWRNPYCHACRPNPGGELPNRDMTPFYTADPEIGLFGGRWVFDPKTRIQRWVQERLPSMDPDLIRACRNCGVTFKPDHPLGRYCSAACRADRQRKAVAKRYAEQRGAA